MSSRTAAGDQPGKEPFWHTSAYVHDAGVTRGLATRVGLALDRVLQHADLIAGHQFSSDLAVLVGASLLPAAGVAAARAAWHQLHHAAPGGRRIVDTRYDAGHVLAGASRRLADVCADLRLGLGGEELADPVLAASGPDRAAASRRSLRPPHAQPRCEHPRQARRDRWALDRRRAD